MIDERDLLERAIRRFEPQPGLTDRVFGRRDRKRRNQRIAAGVVGIAVFVAAIWIVTSGLSFDRTQTPAVPGPGETGPVVTGPAETAPPPAPASEAPRWVLGQSDRPCSDGARSLLKLRVDRRIKVRFEVYRSPVGHEWRIELAHPSLTDDDRNVFFRGTRVASDSGDLVVHERVADITVEQRSNGGYWAGPAVFVAKAVDTQTGERCLVYMEP